MTDPYASNDYHELKIVSTINTPPVRIITRPSAKKLADLYLPVNLRDFYLALHPMLQCYLYDISHTPEEFFTIVMMEDARAGNNKRLHYKRNADWNFVPEVQLMDPKKMQPVKLIGDESECTHNSNIAAPP